MNLCMETTEKPKDDKSLEDELVGLRNTLESTMYMMLSIRLKMVGRQGPDVPNSDELPRPDNIKEMVKDLKVLACDINEEVSHMGTYVGAFESLYVKEPK